MSIMKQIEEIEAIQRKTQNQLDILIEKIQKDLSSEDIFYFEQEINKLKDGLFNTEKELKQLRQENMKSFIFEIAFIILLALVVLIAVYLIYF